MYMKYLWKKVQEIGNIAHPQIRDLGVLLYFLKYDPL